MYSIICQNLKQSSEKQAQKLRAIEESVASRKAMSGREGGVVEWADYAALKAQAADYEARIKELEQDVDEDAAAIQQLEQVCNDIYFTVFGFVPKPSKLFLLLALLICNLKFFFILIITLIITTEYL